MSSVSMLPRLKEEHSAALQQSEHEAAEAASAERLASLDAQLTQND